MQPVGDFQFTRLQHNDRIHLPILSIIPLESETVMLMEKTANKHYGKSGPGKYIITNLCQM